MKNRINTVAAPNFGASCLTGGDIRGAVAQPTRHFPGYRFQKCDLHGKVYPNSDAAFAAMLERGYCEPYYPRTSVVSGCFKGLASQERQARFDALYRLWKHKERGGHREPGCVECDGRLRRKVELMAAKVGIFHPVAAHLNRQARKSVVS